ncbi:prenyltransferase [Paenibacillus favisporus]|uniref:1,4-dihydroxy-2-naphthoate octaprenyltransferase n=1 Tax=Paenibacillus favisporus TaxID=221028 RepID=A0ABV2FC27_9BACL|nr:MULTISPECIES: prenyltransferase [Paenibacillus]MBJ9991554.1 prenyltransferase [Paenibacillus sp. S28]MEC0175350.1 prenyltransferase [Paenibacillus favisporus]RED36450.1 1,4-dihydroxy-2-naphthoate octaprenyltransferase [Paenibacillus sp. VMFN-D1]
MLKQFMKASRFGVVPVMLIPVALGALGAFVWNGVFNVWLFLITLVGAAAAHLFSNMVNDLWDYKSGTDTAAKEAVDAVSTNSGFLTGGVWSIRKFAAVTWALFGVAAACGIILAVFSGPWAFIFGALGGLIAYFYVAPPLKFGYRGKGYSEVAILLSFGVLPVMGAYYVQTSHLDLRALLLSLPIGLLTTLILFNHHFLHWQADRQAGKRTLVVVWGEQRALGFSRFLLFLSALMLVVSVIAGALPVYGLLALPGMIPLYQVYGKLKSHNNSHAYIPLMGASVKSTQRSGIIMIICLLIQGLI